MEDSVFLALAYAHSACALLGQSDEEILVLRARYHPMFDAFRTRLFCYQTFRPDFDALEARGFRCGIAVAGSFRYVLYLATRCHEENLFNLARGIAALPVGGRFVAVVPNSLGAGRVERHLCELAGEVEHLSKAKARVMWCHRREVNESLLEEWLRLGETRTIPNTSLVSTSGVFSQSKVDEGSKLLSRHIPTSLAGCGADLGAGVGYLSVEVLRNCPHVAELSLFEAEKMALDCAHDNLRSVQSSATLQFHWSDVTTGVGEERFDWVVSNPPFHRGIEASPEIGQRFIAVASSSLKPGGVFFLVANRKLPYESVLRSCFRTVRMLADEGGYKVIQAIR